MAENNLLAKMKSQLNSYLTASVKLFTVTTWSVPLLWLAHIPILKQVSYLCVK